MKFSNSARFSLLLASVLLCNTSPALAVTRLATDSTSVVPVEDALPSGQTLNYEADTTQAAVPPSNNENYYGTYSACPATPICKDRTGALPGGALAENCPDICYVKQQVTTNTTTIAGQTVTRVTALQAAVCPANYQLVTEFDVQPEVAWNANPTPAPAPITSLSDWQAYNSNGYDCAFNYIPPPGSSSAASDQCTYAYAAGSYSSAVMLGPLGVAKIVCTSYMGCYSDCIPAYGPAADSTKLEEYCVGSLPPYAAPRWGNCQYEYAQCTAPAGYYITNNYKPSSVLCSHEKPVWSGEVIK